VGGNSGIAIFITLDSEVPVLREVSRHARQWSLPPKVFSPPGGLALPVARPMSSVWVVADASLLFSSSLVFYFLTLAPTILWGDDGHFQLQAIRGTLQASAGGHPLWVAVAHLFTRIPVGELAFRVNLVSALFGAVAVGLLYLCARAAGISRLAAVAAALAFAVSHTFWAHAVRAEVYTMTMAMVALVLLFSLRWYRNGRSLDLALAGLALALALSTHVLILLFGPALLWLLSARRRQLSARSVALAALVTGVALLPLLSLLWMDSRRLGMDLSGTLAWALFSFDGYDFGDRFFRIALNRLASDTGQWLGYLGLQFVGVAFVAGLWGAIAIWKRHAASLATFVLLLYLVPAAFAFAYDVGDRYVFFLPSYLAFALWIGVGIDALWETVRARRPAWAGRGLQLGLVALFALTPVLTYRMLPDLLHTVSPQFREARRVPGPNSRYFLLWPSRANYTDPRDFVTAALAATPPDGVLLAEPALASPMIYLQAVEGFRTDVAVRFCCWDIDQALAESGGRPLVLADRAEEVYPVARLQEMYGFEIVAQPPVYLLVQADVVEPEVGDVRP
jgi:hypothetical protein